MEHIENLEKELSNKNDAIDALRKEKQIKAEETVRAQTVNIVLIKMLGVNVKYIEQEIPYLIDRIYYKITGACILVRKVNGAV